LGAALIGWDQLADAFAYLREALAICRDLGLRGGEAWAIFWLGFAELNLGRYEQAQARGEAVLALARERGDPVYTGRSLWLLGDVALATGAYAKAESLLQRSAADYREYGLPNELIWVFADLAVAAHRMGQLDLSKQHRDEALRMFIKTRAVLSVGRVLGAAALLLADAGETERAVEVYALALRHAAVKKSCWFDDIFGRHIAAVAATLPADIVAAAQERGRARNLDVTVAELLVELDTEARDG
jgi:tetratricopeptide (TPR) repeat protein